MTISQTLYNLFKQTFRDILFQPPSPPHVVKKVSASAELNHKQNVLLRLKIFVESNYILMLRFFEHNNFLHNFFCLRVIRKELLVDALNSAKALGQFVNC